MFLNLVLKIYVQTQLFLTRKEAASGIEYAIVAAMVAVAIVAFVSPISTSIKGIFTSIKTSLGTVGT